MFLVPTWYMYAIIGMMGTHSRTEKQWRAVYRMVICHRSLQDTSSPEGSSDTSPAAGIVTGVSFTWEPTSLWTFPSLRSEITIVNYGGCKVSIQDFFFFCWCVQSKNLLIKFLRLNTLKWFRSIHKWALYYVLKQKCIGQATCKDFFLVSTFNKVLLL